MTRPHVIRADTIDLQDPGAPSAKDHSRQPSRPAALGEGPPGPHQADALRNVELEISEQHGRSPRASQDLSGKELQLLQDESASHGNIDPNENLLRNSTQHATQDDMDDGDGDNDLDDDLTDKISSSPSIGDDGWYPILLPWPCRIASLPSDATPPKKATHSPGPSSDLSSSPFSETPEHYPLSFSVNPQEGSPSNGHHHTGRYPVAQRNSLVVDEYEAEQLSQVSPRSREGETDQAGTEDGGAQDDDLELLDYANFHNLLLPENDPLLEGGLDDSLIAHEESGSSKSSSPASKASWDPDLPPQRADLDDDDDDSEEISYDLNSRFVDSGWGGECLRETEDIDFEFVYALHTFVATVEGQANATKGDTMVLLDDSNSYWWLVKIVKDSTIGYLPAEHIETPLERLARLNKHRNLDLSQTMLGDQEEDKRQNSLNPLKKAIRRRNTKKVEFGADTHVEPSDVEYSTEEEDEDSRDFDGRDQNQAEEQQQQQRQQQQQQQQQQQKQIRDGDESAAVAPLNTRDKPTNGRRAEAAAGDLKTRNGTDQPNAHELARNDEQIMEQNDDGSTTKSRKGTVRVTDSFFKDDSVETRKINLTPSLLRDDSNGGSPRGSESSELKNRVSLDSLEKDTPVEKSKEDKKKKEKRGMLGGMFKRKDKKTKGQDRDGDDNEKLSGELSRKSPTPKESMESLGQDSQGPRSVQPHRQTSKLQKQPPAKLSPKSSYSTPNQGQNLRSPLSESGAAPSLDQSAASAPSTTTDTSGSMRLVLPEPKPLLDEVEPSLQNPNPSSRQTIGTEGSAQESTLSGTNDTPSFSPFVNSLRPAVAESQAEKAKRGTGRMPVDDSDTTSSSSAEQRSDPSPMREVLDEPDRELVSQPSDHHLNVAQAAQHEPHPKASHPELSVTSLGHQPPIQASSAISQERSTPHQPPPLVTDTSSQSQAESSPVSPVSSTDVSESQTGQRTVSRDLDVAPLPQHTDAPTTSAPAREAASDTPSASPATQPSTATASTTTTRSTPTWSDASLRAYMDDDGEIRDLLLVVNDKTGAVPRKDHPVVQGLFRDENQKLGDIEKKLDGLLGDFLSRKGRPVR